VSEPSAEWGRSLRSLSTAGRWVVLLALSAVAAAVLPSVCQAAGRFDARAARGCRPGAGRGWRGEGPRVLLMAAQAIIGCLVARSITCSIVGGFVIHWPVFLGVVAPSIIAREVAGS
jgi:uncharacterized protein